MKKVLIAEDNQFILRGYKMAIEEAGYSVDTVSDGSDVLNTVAASKPDILILDLILPNMNGFDILQALRSKPDTARLPIIVATTLGQEEDRQKVLELGATDYILKSHTSIQDLIIKINAASSA